MRLPCSSETMMTMPDNPSPNKTPSLGLVTNTLLSLSLTAKNVSNVAWDWGFWRAL
jgi:hypothetical protein